MTISTADKAPAVDFDRLRPRIDAALSTGVRAIDGLLTCGKGQRLGIFAGSGVGKSVLLGMMARYTAADVNVIALIGERGREVNEFIQRDLGPQGLARSVVVVATSDEPALLRTRAAETATVLAAELRKDLDGPRQAALRASLAALAATPAVSELIGTALADSSMPLAARQAGLTTIPLLCASEIPVPGSLGKCIRLLLHCTVPWGRRVQHVYLREARKLRPDLAEDAQ